MTWSLILLLSCLLYLVTYIPQILPNNLSNSVSAATEADPYNEDVFQKLQVRSKQLVEYSKNKNFNTSIAFFIDMELASGKNRFFVYDTSTDSILYSALVTHGRCNESWLTDRRYSNVVGSGCTSLGKYQICNKYNGRFGLAYKLKGLESTNSNAFRRYVVLHAHDCVPEKESYPEPICQSDGCPTVSPGFLKILAGIIDNSAKPVLLEIYE